MFEEGLHMLLNWLPKLSMFYFKINLNIKVAGNLLPAKIKKKKPKPNKLQNSQRKMLLNLAQ